MDNPAWRRALRHAVEDYYCYDCILPAPWADEETVQFFASSARRVDHEHAEPACHLCREFVTAALGRIEHDREHQAKYEKYLTTHDKTASP